MVSAAGMGLVSLVVPYPYGWLGSVTNALLILLLLVAVVTLEALRHLFASGETNGAERRIGVAMSSVTSVGVALLLLGAVIEALVGPPIRQETTLERGFGQFVPYLLSFGVLISVCGLLVVGVLALASDVLPRWGGAMLFAANPLTYFLAVVLVGNDLPAPAATSALAWALVGYAVFRVGNAGLRHAHA